MAEKHYLNYTVPIYSLILTGSFAEGRQYRTFRPRGTGDWLMILTTGGAARFGYSGGSTIIVPGAVILIKPGAVHDYRTAAQLGRWDLLWAHFQPRAHWLDLLAWPEIAPGLMQLPLSAELFEQVSRQLLQVHLIAIGGGRRSGWHAMLALEELLLTCDRANPKSALPGIDPRVAIAVEHICSNLSDDLSVDDIAGIVYSSPSRLAHLFKQHIGMSIQQYVEAQRLERAKQLLSMTTRTVQAISADVGFASPFYFSLRFKKLTGQSPSDYRRGDSLLQGD